MDSGQEVSEESRKAWEKAETTPYGAYPELVTYTLGQMSGANNSNLPEGDTYEDNAYTRYLRKMLNIQNDNIYMESEDRYSEFVNIIVKDQTLPDILVVSDRETLKELVENDLIEDLTEVYEKCTSPRIKEMYGSYGGELLEAGEFDGKIMAVPETVIDHGPNLLWLRKDWIDQLGLKEPETLEEAFDVIEAFAEHRMGTEEGEEPVGLACDTGLVGTTSSSYSMDVVFDSFHASPQRWIKKMERLFTVPLQKKPEMPFLFCMTYMKEESWIGILLSVHRIISEILWLKGNAALFLVSGGRRIIH